MDDNSHTADVLRKLVYCTKDNTPRFSLQGKYKCKVVEIVDGDTFRGAMAFLDDMVFVFTFRILGINAPEMKPRLAIADRLAVIRKAKAAKARLTELIADKICDVEVVGLDSFGRALAKIVCDGICVGNRLLQDGHAVKFPFTKL